jgi:hypothetical protein
MTADSYHRPPLGTASYDSEFHLLILHGSAGTVNKGKEMGQLIDLALQAGYRHFE